MLQQLYETRRRALDNVIGEHLVDREARERGITRAALLSVELPSRTSPVTDEEVALVYERNQDSFGGRTLEQMRAQIRVILEQQRPTQALHEFMGELRLAADDVVVLLDPPRQEVAVLAEDPSRGPEDAPGRDRGVLRFRMSLLQAGDRHAGRPARALRRLSSVRVQGLSAPKSSERIQGCGGG